LAAILERHLEIPLGQQDLFFNVAGGMKISEPSTDLAAIAAIWSSHQKIPLPGKSVFVGEVGLTGEIKSVPHIDVRASEAFKLGFETIYVSKDVPESARKNKNLRWVMLGESLN